MLLMLKMVFVAFTQIYTDTQCTAYMPLAHPRGKAPLNPPSCGFSGSPPSSQGRQLCFKMFWDLSNYKGDGRQDEQPIPILKGYGVLSNLVILTYL